MFYVFQDGYLLFSSRTILKSPILSIHVISILLFIENITAFSYVSLFLFLHHIKIQLKYAIIFRYYAYTVHVLCNIYHTLG